MLGTYNKYHKLVRNRANAYSANLYFNAEEFKEELTAEGFLLLIQCSKSYDPKKGKFSTYLQTCLNNKMWKIIQQEVQHTKALSRLEGNKIIFKPVQCESSAFLEDLNDALSEDALFVISLILTSSDKRRCASTGKITKTSLSNYLRKVHKWLYKQVLSVFKEIEDFLRSGQ